MISEAVHMDNMLYMAQFPDKFFDLAIVDPPYGLGKRLSQGAGKHKNMKARLQYEGGSQWDENTPNDAYFTELFRISENQIIWGGNYFTLPPTRGIICWDKKQFMPTFSRWEMAWTSFDCVARIFEGMSNANDRIHPTQKPIQLYQWILTNYAKVGFKVIDTHLGSGSSRIAAHDLGFDFYGCELDKDYYEAQEKRFAKHISQQQLFTPERHLVTQTTLL